MLGRRYVYSRKPTPALVSGANPPWDLARQDMEKTYRATKNCCVELLFRDLYSVDAGAVAHRGVGGHGEVGVRHLGAPKDITALLFSILGSGPGA